MNRISQMFCAAACLCVLAAFTVFAQVVRVEPAQPRAGEKLTVIYDPKAKEAGLTNPAEVYVKVVPAYPNKDYQLVKMRKEGELFKQELTIHPEWARLTLECRTATAIDSKAKVATMIYRDDGKTVRNAYLGEVTDNYYRDQEGMKKAQALLDKEAALYPDNLIAYPAKWKAFGPAMKTDEWKVLVKRDLEVLQKNNQADSPEWLFAVAIAHLFLKQPEKALPLLKQMVTLQPKSGMTAQLLGDLSYSAMAGDLPKAGHEEMRQLTRDFISHYPETAFAREHLWEFSFEDDGKVMNGDFPLANLEALIDRWISDEVDNPAPYLGLAQIYQIRQQKFDRVATLADKAISLLLDNKGQLYRGYDSLDEDLGLAYSNKAYACLQLGRLTEAMQSVKAMQAIEAGSRFKTTDYKSLELEGRIWRALGNTDRAERVYSIAWLRGSDEADTALKEIYQKREGKLDGFRQAVRKRAALFLDKSSAASFSGTSLDGVKYDLAGLKGKIVVLNFWFIGCGPCRAEMPGLNELVREFKDKNVVFLSFASDEPEELREFLKTKPFDYKIVPSAFDVNRAYRVNVWPTHILIDPEGNVAMRLVGGSENRHKELRKLIERMLE